MSDPLRDAAGAALPGSARAGASQPPALRWTDLGRMPYRQAWDLQRALVAERKAGRGGDRLLLVEHPPVLTLGRRADAAHVLAAPMLLEARGIERFEVERGGDVTWHGPGQQVVYPILDLQGFRKDVRWYSGALAAAVVATLASFGIAAEAREGRETGVWAPLGPGAAPAPSIEGWAKLAALGLRIERWIAYHGIALNVDPDLAAFDLILPCGLAGARSSSMAALLGRPIDLAEVRPSLLAALGQTLGRRMLEAGPEDLPFAAGARQPAPDAPSAVAPDAAASVGTAK